MLDNDENRATMRLVLTPAEVAAEVAETENNQRRRRDFLRQAALASIVIPGVGAIALAGDDKKKSPKAASPADAKRGSSTKLNAAHTDSTPKQSTAHGSGPKLTTPKSGAVNAHGHPAVKTSRSSSPIAGNSSQINHASARPSNPTATPASTRRRKSQGKPLPELYKDWNVHNFEQIQADENAHVAFLVNALGTYARPMPEFQDLEQSTVHEFATTARALENTGVGAYLGALPVLASTAAGQQYLAAAGSIALVEARHAGYLNTLINLSLDENIEGDVASFDQALTPSQVVSLASPFIASLNGGPPLIPAGGFVNPLDILNFALALEFLEAAFYNINVPNLARTLAK